MSMATALMCLALRSRRLRNSFSHQSVVRWEKVEGKIPFFRSQETVDACIGDPWDG